MVTISQDYMDELEWTVHQLQPFGAHTAHPPAPEYHGFLGSTTNAAIVLLGQCIVLAGGKFELLDGFTTKHWQSVLNMVHRSYHSSIQMVVEAMCQGYCQTRGKEILPSRKDSKPQFMDHVNSALSISNLSALRQKYWRVYFDGIRILRNKVSHFDPYFTDQEKEILIEAGLGGHISPTGMIQTQPASYVSLAELIFIFIQELEKDV